MYLPMDLGKILLELIRFGVPARRHGSLQTASTFHRRLVGTGPVQPRRRTSISVMPRTARSSLSNACAIMSADRPVARASRAASSATAFWSPAATAGERFARALAAKNSAAPRALLAEPVDFQALTPGRHWQASTPSEVVDQVILGTWFGAGTDIERWNR
jgi:hypothetical protein